MTKQTTKRPALDLSVDGGYAWAGKQHSADKAATRQIKALMDTLKGDFEAAALLLKEQGTEVEVTFPTEVNQWFTGVRRYDQAKGLKGEDRTWRTAKSRVVMALRRWMESDAFGIEGGNVTTSIEHSDERGAEGKYTLKPAEQAEPVPGWVQEALSALFDAACNSHGMTVEDARHLIQRGTKAEAQVRKQEKAAKTA